MKRAIMTLALCLFVAGLVSALPAGGGATEADDSAAKTLQSMISDLEKAIQNADRRMVAHPSFLNELRGLVEQYKTKIRQVFFSDDFSDGNYKFSPKWTVDAGFFSGHPRQAASQPGGRKIVPPQKEAATRGRRFSTSF